MKSLVCHNAQLQLEDSLELIPTKGQVLLEVVRCGICGSDLHMQHHCDHMHDLAARVGFDGVAKSSDKLVFGHEFCGKVLDYEKKTRRKLKEDTLVCAMPLLNVDSQGYMPTGLSASASGGYAEQVLVQSSLMFEVPNGLDADSAALTEPMAVALHAVRRSRIKKNEPAIVIGCGPVGLGVIIMLKAAGVKTVVASDFSPNRRRLAEQCGADILIDPKQQSPFSSWKELGLLGNVSEAINMGMGIFDKVQTYSLPWVNAMRVGDKLGLLPKRPVIFECVGVAGIMQGFEQLAPAPELLDCNANGIHDAYDIANASSLDCDVDGIPDECIWADPEADCDANGVPDLCDIRDGSQVDQNQNGIPDDCECLGDVTGDGTVNVLDIVAVILAWGEPGGPADLDFDGDVGLSDLLLVIEQYASCPG